MLLTRIVQAWLLFGTSYIVVYAVRTWLADRREDRDLNK